MDASYITRQEHTEFAKRVDDENRRQNKRIDQLEGNSQAINELALSVKEMAINMGNMMVEQKKQGERLEKLEQEPLETGKQIKQAIIQTIVGTVVGAVVTAIIMIL